MKSFDPQALRRDLGYSRSLNETTGLVSQWERGEKRPQGNSLKLLTLVPRTGLATVA